MVQFQIFLSFRSENNSRRLNEQHKRSNLLLCCKDGNQFYVSTANKIDQATSLARKLERHVIFLIKTIIISRKSYGASWKMGFSMVWTVKEAQIWHEKYLSNELHKLPSPWCRVLSPSHTPFPHILQLQFLIVQKKKERFLRALSPRADKQYSSQRTARSHTWTVTNMSWHLPQ